MESYFGSQRCDWVNRQEFMPILYSLLHRLWIDKGVALTLSMGVCAAENPVVW